MLDMAVDRDGRQTVFDNASQTADFSELQNLIVNDPQLQRELLMDPQGISFIVDGSRECFLKKTHLMNCQIEVTDID